MKKILFLLLPLILYANNIQNIYIKSLHDKINTYVEKENSINLYIQDYVLNNFDNNITRKKIIIFEHLNNNIFTNLANESCTINNSYCTENNGIELNITTDKIELKNTLGDNINNISPLINDIYHSSIYTKLNNYIIDTNKYYINNKKFYYAMKLLKKLYNTNYYQNISILEPNPNLKIWFKPNGINGIDLYIYDTNLNKWIFNNTIGYNKNPYSLTFEDYTLFNPLTFPGIDNMEAIVNKNNIITKYIYNNNQWIEDKINTSNITKDQSNILDLVTKDLLLPADNIRLIQSNIFFNNNQNVKKYGSTLENSFWKNDNIILANDFNKSISEIDNNQKYIFYANKTQDNYIPMIKINKWIYLSKTNNFQGVLEYPYNENNNTDGPNIGNDITNTDHLILSWDGFDKQFINNNKIYFKYNNSNKIFDSIKKYDNTLIDTIHLSINRNNFNNLLDNNSYYSLYSNCDNNTNLGDGKCHNNNLFGGDKDEGLYKWYSKNNKLYDAHLVNSFTDMYKIKNNNNAYYNLQIFNNNLYDLVEDNNKNFCYKKRLDNLVYTLNGQTIQNYDTNHTAILPIDKTCQTLLLNNNNYVFNDIYEMIKEFNNAKNGIQVKINNNIYTKVKDSTNDYWIDTINKIIVSRTRSDITNISDPLYKYITLYLGDNTDLNDINKNHRFSDFGKEYIISNNKILYEWNVLDVPKAINKLIDSKIFNTLKDAYDSNEKQPYIYINNDNKLYKIKQDNNIYCYMDEYNNFYTYNGILIPRGKNGYINNISKQDYTHPYCYSYTKKGFAFKNNNIYIKNLTQTPISTDINTTIKENTYNGYVVKDIKNYSENICGKILNCYKLIKDDSVCIPMINNNLTNDIGALPAGLKLVPEPYIKESYDYSNNPKTEDQIRPNSCSGGTYYNNNWYISVKEYSFAIYGMNYKIITDGTTCPNRSDFVTDSNGNCQHIITTTKTIKSCSNQNYIYNKELDICEYNKKCYNYICPNESNYWNNNWILNNTDFYSTCYNSDKLIDKCDIQDFYNVPKKN